MVVLAVIVECALNRDHGVVLLVVNRVSTRSKTGGGRLNRDPGLDRIIENSGFD